MALLIYSINFLLIYYCFLVNFIDFISKVVYNSLVNKQQTQTNKEFEMKKGLLLSVVASTMIFAGGDIAPVEPAAPAPAADCSDFYGSVGAYYQSNDFDLDTDLADNDLFGKATANFDVVATIGVEKELFAGIGFGAEASAWTRTSGNIAANHRVSNSATREDGSLTQMYLTGSFANTAVKVGRFAIPGSLSPLLRTGTTAGVKDWTYDGVLVANTDIADTTVYGVWVYALHAHSGFNAGSDLKLNDAAGDVAGAFAFGFQNKSIANTTITAVGYYGKEFLGAATDMMAGAVNVDTVLGDYTINAQGTYIDKDAALGTATSTAGLKVSTTYGDFDIMLAAAYRNDGTYATNLAGGNGSLIGDAIDFEFGGANAANEGYAVGAQIGYKVWKGRAYARASYQDYKPATASTPLVLVTDNITKITAGYTFKVAGIDFKAEGQYGMRNYNAGGVVADRKNARVRLEAAYKF